MRSQRLQKVSMKGKPMRGIDVATDLRFSRFEFMNVTLQTNGNEGTFTIVDPYKADNTSIYGVAKVQDFSEDLKYKRREGLKNPTGSTFSVDLAYAGDATGYKCVRLVFTYAIKENVMQETAEIQVFAESKTDSTQKYQLTVKDLNLDSDVTEYLFRFTKGLEWNSETYAILDCNPNLSVNKGIYLTMNVPFESNIAWGVEKRKLIIAYRFVTPSSGGN